MDDTTASDTLTEPTPNEEALAALRPSKPVNKPDLSALRDALDEEGRPKFVVGDKIVIERYAGTTLPGSPYIDTRTYRVASLDMETGNCWLADEDLGQSAGTNWKTAPRGGDVFKFAPGRGGISTKRKRGRPRKTPLVEAPLPTPGDTPVKKKRGRPPGSKNRPASVRAAEKAAKKQKRR